MPLPGSLCSLHVLTLFLSDVDVGTGTVEVDGRKEHIEPGSLIFVAKNQVHRFCDYKEDLSLLVAFSPRFTGD